MPKNSNTDPKPQCVQTDVSGSVTKKELRIGNWLFVDEMINNHIISQIRETMVNVEYIRIDTNEPHCSLISVDRLKPIKLTEKLLLNFGWVLDYETDDFKEYINYKLDIDSINYVPSKNIFYFNCWENTKCPQSIHQLQNLYFSLTGLELTDR